MIKETILILFSLTLFLCACGGNGYYTNSEGEAAFTEAYKPLDPEKKYSNPEFSEVEYSALLEKMKGMYEVETDRSLLQLRSGNELHMVMIENGKPNSDHRMILRDCKIGPTDEALVFMGKDKSDSPMVVSIELETEEDLIVKMSTRGEVMVMRGKVKRL
jgi:hypothetical protein